MKSTKQERKQDALERLKDSTWGKSKAKRLGTRTETEWQAWKEQHIEELS